MPENPRLSSLGMNGILSKRSGSFFRHGLAWAKVMPGRPAFQKPWALAQGGSLWCGIDILFIISQVWVSGRTLLFPKILPVSMPIQRFPPSPQLSDA